MIDHEDRTQDRFPPEKEPVAREHIKTAIQEEMSDIGKGMTLRGIAGGACGGDILFHEVCRDLGIQTEMYLALPEKQFKDESVAFAGISWVERFNKLYRELPHSILSHQEHLSAGVETKGGYNIWGQNNLLMLNTALKNGITHMSLIALWDGKGGDDFGGTEHMVSEARRYGVKVIIIDPGQL